MMSFCYGVATLLNRKSVDEVCSNSLVGLLSDLGNDIHCVVLVVVVSGNDIHEDTSHWCKVSILHNN